MQPMRLIMKLTDDEIRMFSGGNYGYKQRNKYIEHNQDGETLTLFIHTCQINYDAWEQNRFVWLRERDAGVRRANLKRIDDNAWNDTQDRFVVVKVARVTSRHTRKNKPTKGYTGYVSVDRRGPPAILAALPNKPTDVFEAEDVEESWKKLVGDPEEKDEDVDDNDDNVVVH